ncbi:MULTISPECIES: hypothetical protein [Rhizobium]|uniref:hypothetical protein n=1 Tax=Rhizobium TaxID=379 RepID=UPI00195A2264|nr:MULTISPECIES: hypothetical protein [Rhizobium]MBM7047546.1 hypothetical protein [Rhizobium lusitanum]
MLIELGDGGTMIIDGQANGQLLSRQRRQSKKGRPSLLAGRPWNSCRFTAA